MEEVKISDARNNREELESKLLAIYPNNIQSAKLFLDSVLMDSIPPLECSVILERFLTVVVKWENDPQIEILTYLLKRIDRIDGRFQLKVPRIRDRIAMLSPMDKQFQEVEERRKKQVEVEGRRKKQVDEAHDSKHMMDFRNIPPPKHNDEKMPSYEDDKDGEDQLGIAQKMMILQAIEMLLNIAMGLMEKVEAPVEDVAELPPKEEVERDIDKEEADSLDRCENGSEVEYAESLLFSGINKDETTTPRTKDADK